MERYEAYKDSSVEWIGEIPERWKVAPLCSLCSISGGATPSKDRLDYWNGDIPWVSSQEVKSSHLRDTSLHITREAIESCSTDVYPTGSVVVVVRSGILKHTLPAAIIDAPMSVNQDIKALEFKSFTTANYFLQYVFGMNDHLLRHLSKEGATVDNLDVHLFSKCPVVFPSIKEQQAIVDYLDTKTTEIDALVVDCEREVELLREYRKAVISEAVTKGLDPDVAMKDSCVEWIGEVPAEWEIRRVKTLACGQEALFLDGDWIESDVIEDEGIRYLTTGNVGDGYYKEQGTGFISKETFDKLKCLRVLPGDVLISRLNEPLGRACLAPDAFNEYVIAVDVVVIRGEAFLNRFLVYAMNEPHYAETALMRARGSTMKRISRTILGELKLPIPPIEEQQAIADYLDTKTAEIDSLITAKREMVDKLREYRKSLISEAVTGKFKVPGVK